MGEVLRVLEGSLAPMFCVTDATERDICAFEDSCGTRVLWARVRDGINEALDSTLLSDLLADAAADAGPTTADTMPLIVPATMGPAQCEEYQPVISH